MAVERIKQLDIDNRGLVTALVGNLADTFIDVDLRKYTFNQQLYEYLKYNGFETIVFYDRNDGLFTYEEKSFQNFLGQNNTEKVKQPTENSDGRPINGRFKQKAEETPENSKLYKWRSGFGFYQIQGVRDAALTDKFKSTIRQIKVKTALIFNSPEIQIDNRDEFISNIQTVFNDYSTHNNQNKILLNYGLSTESEFARYFNTKQTIFADNFFRDLFIKGEEINKDNVFIASLPMQDEIRNLLNLVRLKDNKTVDWNEFENIIEMLVVENRALAENEKKLNGISELSMEELVNNKVIKKKTIDFDRSKVQFILNDVKGQDENIEIIAEDIEFWASEEKREKPLSFFLVGQSGTGKTHTAKTFAKALESSGFEFVSLQMEGFQESHTISKLLGSPPGYTGYRDKSELFTKIKENRRLVILFDEIEKAHTNVFTSLMNLVAEGILNSSDGYKGDFKECILFFTSNLAMNEVVQIKKDFLKDNTRGNKTVAEILKDSRFKEKTRSILLKELQNNGLTPKHEVWNRLGYFLTYDNLKDEYIIEIFIDVIRKSAQKKKITINKIATDYLSYLIGKQHELSSGMRDLTQKEIPNNIQSEIKKQQCKTTCIYDVHFDNEEENIVFSESNNAEIDTKQVIVETLDKHKKKSKTTNKYDWNILSQSLSEVYCQQDNTELILKEVKSWLREPYKDKPLVFLLAGTSGTGKTFTAQKIAEGIDSFGYAYRKFNMNECLHYKTLPLAAIRIRNIL